MRADLQSRIEAAPVGRAAITAVIAFVIVAILTPNLPGSELARHVTDAVRPVRDATGLDGTWGVFAPGPRQIVIDVWARLEYPDGSVHTWKAPTSDDVIGTYRIYHWQKWMEQVYSDDYKNLWRPLAEWLARTQTVDGIAPTTVTLVRRWKDIPPPGEVDEAEPAWQEFEYFTYQVPDGRGS